MDRNTILLVDGDTDTYTAALSAAQILGLEVRGGQIRHDLSEFTEYELDDVAAIILDYDPHVHGGEISEELSHWDSPRPLIFITNGCADQRPLLREGPAIQHLTKPVNAVRLVRVLDDMLEHPVGVSCDRWGHPRYGALVE